MRTNVSSTRPVTSTQEDYIRAMYILELEEKGASVTQVAKRLKLSKSTVSERIKELVRDGLVVAKPYSDIALSKKGLALGEKLTFKHRLIEVFLYQTLKTPKDNIHKEAELLEHAISDDMAKRLAKFLNYPTKDPHGSPIPNIKKPINY
ncbi:metal-dependent transcriptional regulator [Candidatus Nomurabacteria bacterium]|nr:metal-dependent transcriptional regulator [Candidatus Nomurabacteria bacterium]